MVLRVFLSHASVDKPFVEEVKRALEDGGDIECWLDSYEIGFGDNIITRINYGLTESDYGLLFLSAASLKSRWVTEEWTSLYWTQTNSDEVRLIPILSGDCQIPSLLKNKKYRDLRTNQLEGMRELKAFLLRRRGAHPGVPGASLPNPARWSRLLEWAAWEKRGWRANSSGGTAASLMRSMRSIARARTLQR